MNERSQAGAAPGPAGRVLAVDTLIENALDAARHLAAEGSTRAAPEMSVPRMAPETTGRTAHAVDGRADLYALGATLYEWATGQPPFQERDPLKLVHEQLTRVPQAPSALRPGLPPAFSDIVLRLLDKEPEQRYKSPEGLIHDLERLRRAMRRDRPLAFAVGERDFAASLEGPAHPVGRERELSRLGAALGEAAAGKCAAVLVTGPAGCGKTALVNELRPSAAACNARFVVGNFDPRGRQEPAGVIEAMAALARLLLTESDEALAAQRERIFRALGHEAVLAAVIPEFKVLLGDVAPPANADPVHTSARLMKLVGGLLRAIASAERPVVLVLDGLQWSRVALVRLVENLYADEGVAGLLLVGIYRTGELPAGHPVAATVASWPRRQPGLTLLEIGNLGEDNLARMLAHMLRIPERRTASLARLLGAHTGGNPQHTIELVNALRHERLLVANASGWRWKDDAIRHYVDSHGRADLLVRRVSRLPPAALEVLQALAFVGTEPGWDVARCASGLADSEFDARIRVLVHQGLVVRQAAPRASLRLQHDRVQAIACASVPVAARAELHLLLARRLSCAGFGALAAFQYLDAAEVVRAADECLRAAKLLALEAARARTLSNYAGAQRMLETALEFMRRAAAAARRDEGLRTACQIDLHHTLCARGRLAEADDVYHAIEEGEPDPLRSVDAACLQLGSLSRRGRRAQAVALGLQFLRRLGIDVPATAEPADFKPAFERFRKWALDFDARRELARANASSPEVIAAAKMFNRLASPIFYANIGLACWLVFENQRLWEQHGPCAALTANLSRACLIAPEFGDLRTGYALGREIVAFCEARAWEPECSQCRYIFASCSLHWFEPLEAGLAEARRATEGMLAAGDLDNACSSYRTLAVAAFETSASIESFERELDAAFELAQATGDALAREWFTIDEQLLRALRGQTDAQAPIDSAAFPGRAVLTEQDASPMVVLGYQARRAICCAIFGDGAGLAVHARAAAGVPSFQSIYSAAWARWLFATSIAWDMQEAAKGGQAVQDERGAELERCIDWIHARAEDAPANFRHMHLHVLAERAWAMRDAPKAALLFDQALEAVDGGWRPWHRALITERAGRFHIAHGRERAGARLLEEARAHYLAWGATAKARQLGGLGPAGPSARRDAGPWSADDPLDTLAALRASQAIASERNPEKLKAQVEAVLGSIAGATRVVLALRDKDEEDWMVDRDGGGAMHIAQAGSQLPLSVFRYVERTREPLLLADATADDRFARDPYFAGVARCSLLVVPIVNEGVMRAMLVLENTASRGAFTTARIDAVLLLANQLAASLENSQLYERLERKVREQTQQLREAHSRILAEARRAGMAQIATNVLHNVGNVLNNVNVSAHVLAERVRGSRSARVADLAQLLHENASHLGEYLEGDEKGRLLPDYLRQLAQALESERDELLAELGRLGASVDHIKNVVATQQSYAGARGAIEQVRIAELVDDALRIQEDALAFHRVKVTRDYEHVGAAELDKTRVIQILVNLIENAYQAMQDVEGERRLELLVATADERIRVEVRDCGCGIEPGNIDRIFTHGFTTRANGHGFGLHSCLLAAREMGGSLSVHSDGAGTGATFILELPARMR